jgi:hypothetical protein
MIEKNKFPCYAVRNPWVDFAKESFSKHFEISHAGLEEAIEYCAENKLNHVLYLKDFYAEPEIVWENK